MNSPPTVLIVDDDRISLVMLQAMVRSLGLNAIPAANVTDALKILKVTTPQIAILDVILPDGDGTDILVAIRQARLGTTVAFISATLREFPFHKCQSFQPDMIFEKPFVPETISAWIEQTVHADAPARKGAA